MVNPDCARSKLDKMCQMKGESIAQYHVRLRLQVAKCSFADPDDAIRSKILQTMSDKKLRREAMVKRYTLQQLLEHAANKKDIDRQAQDMEKVLTSETVPVNRVHERRPQSSKGQRHKKKAPPNRRKTMGTCANTVNSTMRDHDPSAQPPEKHAPLAPRKVIAKMCKGKQKGTGKPKGTRSAAKSVQPEQDSSLDSDYVFQLQPSGPHSGNAPTVHVLINGVKGKMEADSGSSANILDEKKFQKLQDALEQKISLQPTDTKLYAFAQKEPVPLLGCFDAEIESVSTGKKTVTQFLVVKGTTMSRPLLSLNTSVELGLLQLANTTYAEVKPPTGSSAISDQDHVVTQLTSEFNDVFSGLEKHKKIKAKVIVDETVTPIAHKPRKIPHNLAQKAANEEQRLKELGVIETVPDDQPTTWCTNPVIAPKPHNLEAIRFCSDMRVPNTAILRPVTEDLTVDDIKFKLEGATVFSVLDMNEGYHQLELDEFSRHLTTFYGTNSRMRY